MGKSAQLPLTVWLPDAMAGPTPVSALIHAATMVTAGTYLLMRLFPLVQLSPTAMLIIAGVGAVTALYASFAALAQWDIKKMLAYSTISQVGYMFLAVGAGDIVGGLFHLVSHAFFKALLFLAAGIVIQALAEEHNIFRMGNLRRRLPAVYWLFLIGAVSLSAFPLLGGFFSKDRILLATFIHPGATYKIFWLIGLAAAFLTPLYTFRVFFVAFPERTDGRGAEQIQPTPRFMAWVLWPLAVCALGDGLLNLPGGIRQEFSGQLSGHRPRGPAGPGGFPGDGMGHGNYQRRHRGGLHRPGLLAVSPPAGPGTGPGRLLGPPVFRLLSGPALSVDFRPALSSGGPLSLAAGG